MHENSVEESSLHQNSDCSSIFHIHTSLNPEAEFKEFEPRLDTVQTWLVQLEILRSVSRFKPALNWNRFLGGSVNSLNSASDIVDIWNQ